MLVPLSPKRSTFSPRSSEIRRHAGGDEIRRDRSGEVEGTSRAWVGKAELPRVEHLPRKPRAPAIHFVAEHGMPEVFEVDANLVRAPRVQRALHECPAGECGEH